MTATGPSPTVIIPTLNAAGCLPALVNALRAQSSPPGEIVVIDSSSGDGTQRIARELGCRVEVVARGDFDHGATRNRAARLARGELLVFLTQDALPFDTHFLEKLLAPLLAGEAEAATARQVAPPDANPLETFSRAFNYPPASQLRDHGSRGELGIMAYFFSNSGSVVKRSAFEALGGFPEGLVVNEDLLFCTRLLKAGYHVAYQADALLIHGHAYGPAETFQRYFDIGCFFTQAAAELDGVRLGGRGLEFALGQLRYLASHRAWRWIPRSLLESGCKWLGYALGRQALRMPTGLSRRLSRQQAFWRRRARS